jgi:hypothetical protein
MIASSISTNFVFLSKTRAKHNRYFCSFENCASFGFKTWFKCPFNSKTCCFKLTYNINKLIKYTSIYPGPSLKLALLTG